MATGNINITVDEEALKAQVGGIVTEAMRGASLQLRRAADALDPEFMPRFIAAERAAWERQQAGKVGHGPVDRITAAESLSADASRDR